MKTRNPHLAKGLLLFLVCSSDCVAQEWQPITVANGPAPALSAPVQDHPGFQPPLQAPASPATGREAYPTTPAGYQPPLQAPASPAVDPAVYPRANPSEVVPAAAPVPQLEPAADESWLPGFLNRLPHPPAHTASLLQPAPAPQYTCPSPTTPTRYFEPGPLLDPPNGAQIGWYASLEIQYAFVHIYKDLAGGVVAGSRPPDIVDLPNRGLDGTVAPLVELGYHLPEAFGSFAVSWRGLGSGGSTQTFGPDGPANLQSRMDLNVINLDYVSQLLFFKENWSMRWRVGARLAYLYYDSVLNQPLGEAAAGTGILEQQATNSYWGLGPHATLELAHPLGVAGLSLLGTIDTASLFGRIKQGSSETALDPASPSGVSFGQNSISSSQTCPTTSLSLGLNWQPSDWGCMNLFIGYQYEYWWNVGRLSLTPDSRGELQIQGAVARFQVNY